MKYILLSEQNKVKEIIPGENPVFPGLPIEKRYSADFIARLMPVDDSVEVAKNMIYDPETETFAFPVIVEAVEHVSGDEFMAELGEALGI